MYPDYIFFKGKRIYIYFSFENSKLMSNSLCLQLTKRCQVEMVVLKSALSKTTGYTFIWLAHYLMSYFVYLHRCIHFNLSFVSNWLNSIFIFQRLWSFSLGLSFYLKKKKNNANGFLFPIFKRLFTTTSWCGLSKYKESLASFQCPFLNLFLSACINA